MSDTNLIAILVKLMADKSNGSANTITIIGMVIAALAPVIASVAAWFMSRAALGKTVEALDVAVGTKETVEKIHVDTNSKSDAMASEIKVLTKEILRLSEVAALNAEFRRTQELKMAVEAERLTKVPAAMNPAQLGQVVDAIKMLPPTL